MRLLFWNTRRFDNAALLARLARENQADVLVFAEPGTHPANLLEALNTGESSQFFLDPRAGVGLSERLQIFYRYLLSAVHPVQDAFDIAIRKIEPPLESSFLLVAAHLSSKLYLTSEDQLISARRFAEIIEEAEQAVGHNRTIVVGDFNVNPFESAMVGGLHAVQDRRIALRSARTVQGRQYRFFYNPMWNLLGDRHHSPGSYYYSTGAYVNYYWNIFDQVLLRPELTWNFNPETDVRILSRIDRTELTEKHNGRPKKDFSDHLPILLNLELEEVIK